MVNGQELSRVVLGSVRFKSIRMNAVGRSYDGHSTSIVASACGIKRGVKMLRSV